MQIDSLFFGKTLSGQRWKVHMDGKVARLTFDFSDGTSFEIMGAGMSVKNDTYVRTIPSTSDSTPPSATQPRASNCAGDSLKGDK